MKNRVIWLAAILLIGLMGFGASYAAEGENLLTNGGFEDGVMTPWNIYAGDTGANGAVVEDLAGAAVPGGPIEGDYCLYVEVPTAGTNHYDAGLQTWQGQTFEAGKHYTLSAYFKSKSGPLQINFKVELGQDPWTGYAEQMTDITEEWVEYSITTSVFAADVSPSSLTWHIAAQAGEFWVDGARFYEGDYVPPGARADATKPDPAHGSAVAPMISGTNVYMTLDYTPGAGAITHTGYFSDVEQDVIDRDAAHSLGNPPYPGIDPEIYYVGYDAPEVEPFARAPLVRGTTYYWAIDEFNGVSTAPGSVWSFFLMPDEAWGPTPADGEALVSTDTTLSWNLGALETDGYSIRYNLYMGTDEAAIEAIANGDTVSPEYVGTLDLTSHEINDLEPETEYFWRVDTKRLQSLPPFPIFYETGDVWSFTTAPVGTGSILYESWLNIGGGDIDALRNEPNYPDDPDTSELRTLFEAPSFGDAQENFGARLHGWLVVGQTGDYTFWIVADDVAELWLSTDMSPSNAVLVSQCTSWSGAREFDNPNVIPSDPIHLEGGRQYYISGLMVEGVQGDHVSAAWQGPDTYSEAAGEELREVIPGKHLKPFLPVTAANPDPADNSADAPLSVTLKWDAGTDESTGGPYATQHVYLGSDPAAVAAATTASPEYMGAPTGLNEYGPLSLSYIEQVYWRVDGEVASSGMVAYPGDVWTFTTLIDPAWAGNPSPPDGATDVDRNTLLSWTPGVGATAHSVYLGADDPANMVQVAGPSGSTTYNPPGGLDLGTTYYWRVVESPGMGEGLTWQFTTRDYLVVDDMESYTPWTTPNNNIFEIWLDGFGDCAGSGNNTGAVLTEIADPVLGGVQSMKYEFDNDGMVFSPCDSAQEGGHLMYSKAEAQTADLVSGIGSDWTVDGVKALYIPFHGQPGSATTESLWIQLQDGSKGYGEKVFYGAYEGESLDNFSDASWHDWYIDLADFDVDLGNVVSITIGIGDETKDTAFGSGILYFDEIRLYVPSCVPSRSTAAFALVDYAPEGNRDCVVDYKELAVMTNDWLQSDMTVNPEAISTGPVAWYNFENNVLDSTANGNDGAAVLNPSYVLSRPDMGYAIDCNGAGDYVSTGKTAADLGIEGNNPRTVAAWVYVRAFNNGAIFDMGNRANGEDFCLRTYSGADHPADEPWWRIQYWGGDVTETGWSTGDFDFTYVAQNEWVHFAHVHDGTYTKVYANGEIVADVPRTINTSSASPFQIAMYGWTETSLDGQIDDLRVYDYGLSHGQILTAAGIGASIYVPITSPANLTDPEGTNNLKVNFKDFSVLLGSWRDTEEWPAW